MPRRVIRVVRRPNRVSSVVRAARAGMSAAARRRFYAAQKIQKIFRGFNARHSFRKKNQSRYITTVYNNKGWSSGRTFYVPKRY